MDTTQTASKALKNGRDKYYTRPIVRTYSDGAVDVRMPGGNHAHYEAGTFTIVGA